MGSQVSYISQSIKLSLFLDCADAHLFESSLYAHANLYPMLDTDSTDIEM